MGFLVFLGIRHEDTTQDLELLIRKTHQLRVFEDTTGRMNLSLDEVGGEVLVISQLTLYADTRKGNRPSFVRAALPEKAQPLYEAYVEGLRTKIGAARVKTGWFGAEMAVEIHNSGPVTIEICSED